MALELPCGFTERIRREMPGESEALIRTLDTESPVSIRLNPAKYSVLPSSDPILWSRDGYYLKQRPLFTADPLFHAGTYYVQEASSQFLGYIVRTLFPESHSPVRALDLCAAPGGKTTLLASALPAGSLLVANEVIGSRVGVLEENAVKWGTGNIVVTSNKAEDFGRLKGFFDLAVIDAPCSGEGLFRRDPDSRSQWSEANVALCAARQRSIVADAWDALSEGGVLVYSTCTYNRSEDEENISWISDNFPVEEIKIDTPDQWNILRSEAGGTGTFKFLPGRIKGEGFFIAALRKTGNCVQFRVPKKNKKQTLPVAPKAECKILEDALSEPARIVSFRDSFYAIKPEHDQDAEILVSELSVRYFGTELGQVIKGKIVPAHALAISTLANRDNFITLELGTEDAVRFLRKEPISAPLPSQGWILICYRNLGLGWLKSVGGRGNNYYPTPWRIRMPVNEKDYFSIAYL